MSEKILQQIGASGKEKYKKLAANADDWARAVKKIDPVLASMLGENKFIGFKRVEDLKLPRYESKTLRLAEFMKNHEMYLSSLGSKLFYIGLIPKTKNLKRYGEKGISANSAIEFVRENVSEDNIENYDIILQQYFENKYGGNIQIGFEPNQVLVEFKRGHQGEIAKGIATPEFIVRKDINTGVFKYTFDDEQLKKVIYKTIMSIPHETIWDGNANDAYGRNIDIKLRPGYYEFFLIKRDENSELEPIFFDCKDYDFDWRVDLSEIKDLK